MLLKLVEVTIYVPITSTSTFKGFSPKDVPWKTEFFAFVISRK